MYWAEHVGIIVSDMERSVKFYSGLFEAEPIQKVEFRGKGAEPVAAMVGQPGIELDVTFFQIPHTNTIIELVKYYHLPGQARVTYPPEAIGGLHLAFFAEDLDEAVKRLQRIGATIMTPVDLIFGAYTGGRAVYFRGPDNELLQIMAVTQRPGKLPVLRPSMPAPRR
ncbi:MAG TPA: VOC family protein [bacterium]|nr:VOC family protein [bacterium]